jgi:hypothetical protein
VVVWPVRRTLTTRRRPARRRSRRLGRDLAYGAGCWRGDVVRRTHTTTGTVRGSDARKSWLAPSGAIGWRSLISLTVALIGGAFLWLIARCWRYRAERDEKLE